ncbi:cysteine proteinase [Terfezia boudieri ATCC MYA-4762]|uniref:Cysteine proteinase n=1 Tax=Terfezia boudieri ATCC MYA-4762 TaxID=1051890 RepID=A0A3N4MBV7_9PEZI|nr:cysteine proteinase [Terfezia boudieri ATCC MYA-4762]
MCISSWIGPIMIWWKLKQPCLDIDTRFFKGKLWEIKPTPMIEEREDKFKSAPELPPLGNATYKAIQDNDQEALDRKHRDIANSVPFTQGTRDVRNTRSRNAQRAKPVTSYFFGVGDNDGAYSGSPTRPLVWPSSGKKRVTVDYQDLERLEEEQFLNDNIINFYLRKANLQALMKWTARVDLFTKQYVIIPINENAHWYLAIICNLPHLEAKIQANAGNSQAEETVVSTSDSPLEEEGASSEVELPLLVDATPDRMDIDDPNEQRPTTAEGQLLSELSNLEPANLPEPMDIDESGSGHEDEWPSEEGLEGVSDHHISEFNYSGDGEIIVNIDDSDKKGVKRQKKLPTRIKKPPKPVDLNNPTIIILDSLSTGLHPRTFALLKEYLEVEASEKKGWIIPRGIVNGIYAKVPRQPNHCDCGVYLLCYVEGFLHAAEAFAQEFLQKVDCQEGRFDDMAFTGKRQELRELIIRLYEEQHGDQAKNDVANGCAVDVQAQPNSRPARSEEIHEVRHEGGGPRPIEYTAAMKESGPRPKVPDQALMDLVNSIQSQQSTGLGPTSLAQSSGIIQSRRFTPAPEIGRQAGLGSTSSSHFSHVEIPNKVRASSPASLQSSPSSLESPPLTKEPWHAPLRAPKNSPTPENDDYAVSVDQDFEATVSNEL